MTKEAFFGRYRIRKVETMIETTEENVSPERLSGSSPGETGSAVGSATRSRQQPPGKNPARTELTEVQSEALPLRKERRLATKRQSPSSGAALDFGEVHLFLCNRTPTADGPPQISSAHVGRFRNVEAAIEHASQPSVRADIVLVVATDLLEKRSGIGPGENGQIKS